MFCMTFLSVQIATVDILGIEVAVLPADRLIEQRDFFKSGRKVREQAAGGSRI